MPIGAEHSPNHGCRRLDGGRPNAALVQINRSSRPETCYNAVGISHQEPCGIAVHRHAEPSVPDVSCPKGRKTMRRFHTLQSPDSFRVLTFRRGEAIRSFLPRGIAEALSVLSSISGTMTRSGRMFFSGIQRFAHTRSNGSKTCQTRANLMLIPVSHPQLNVTPPRLAIANEVIPVLSVSPIQQDHDTLAKLLGHDQWRIHNALSLQSASAFLRAYAVPLVIYCRVRGRNCWTKSGYFRFRPSSS